jgi:hypothetical protein
VVTGVWIVQRGAQKFPGHPQSSPPLTQTEPDGHWPLFEHTVPHDVTASMLMQARSGVGSAVFVQTQ